MGKRAADVVGTTGVRSPQPKAHKATSSEEAASGAAAIDQAAHDKAVIEAAAVAAAEPKPEVPKVLYEDSEKAAHDQAASGGAASGDVRDAHDPSYSTFPPGEACNGRRHDRACRKRQGAYAETSSICRLALFNILIQERSCPTSEALICISLPRSRQLP